MSVGPTELLLIFGAVLLLFGPSKLPEMAKSLGEATRQYRSGMSNAKNNVRNEIENPTELSEEDKLVNTAKNLGIPTEGRRIEDIAQDILNHSE